jgi:hypothetical protein
MLLQSKVPRSLEKKARLFGFELTDLLIIFLYLALSNLIFGQTRLKPFMVWGGTTALASGLYFFKRGKPDGYVGHYGEFMNAPSVLSAGAPDTEYRVYLKTAREESNEKSQSAI